MDLISGRTLLAHCRHPIKKTTAPVLQKEEEGGIHVHVHLYALSLQPISFTFTLVLIVCAERGFHLSYKSQMKNLNLTH